MIKIRSGGFSLIELMIALAIVAILVAVAMPSYQESVQKSRRSDGKIALEKAAAMEEQHYFLNNQYSNSVNNLGGSAGTLNSPEGHYAITVAFGADNQEYTLTATARNTSPQWNDTKCRRYQLDNTGAKRSYNSSGAENTTTADCLP